MANRIHFICKDQQGIAPLDVKAGIYTSEAWLLTPEQIAALAGGEVIFYETKSKPSYFGGTILDSKRSDDEEPNEQGRSRWTITLQSRLDCKGLDWDKSGQTHGMAWTSGVVSVSV